MPGLWLDNYQQSVLNSDWLTKSWHRALLLEDQQLCVPNGWLRLKLWFLTSWQGPKALAFQPTYVNRVQEGCLVLLFSPSTGIIFNLFLTFYAKVGVRNGCHYVLLPSAHTHMVLYFPPTNGVLKEHYMHYIRLQCSLSCACMVRLCQAHSSLHAILSKGIWTEMSYSTELTTLKRKGFNTRTKKSEVLIDYMLWTHRNCRKRQGKFLLLLVCTTQLLVEYPLPFLH